MNQNTLFLKIFFLFFFILFVIYFKPIRTDSNMLFLAETAMKEFINESLEGYQYYRVVNNLYGPKIVEDEYCKYYKWEGYLKNGDTIKIQSNIKKYIFIDWDKGCSDCSLNYNNELSLIFLKVLDVNLIIEKKKTK